MGLGLKIETCPGPLPPHTTETPTSLLPAVVIQYWICPKCVSPVLVPSTRVSANFLVLFKVLNVCWWVSVSRVVLSRLFSSVCLYIPWVKGGLVMNKVKNKRGVCKMSGVKNYTTTMLAEQQWHQQVEREGERERGRERESPKGHGNSLSPSVSEEKRER